MKRHKRDKHLTPAQKAQFLEAAQSFKKDMVPLFTSLTAFGDSYKAIHAITEAIDAAYGKLDIEKPDVR